MANHRVSLRTAFLAVTLGTTAIALAGSTVVSAAPANAPKPKALVGTFKLTPGETVAAG